MDKKEFAVLVAVVRDAYPTAKFLKTDESMKLWYDMLQDLDFELASRALSEYIKANKFPPTIADIRQLAAEQLIGEDPGWSTAWDEVRKAISSYGYHRADEAMDSLSLIIQTCVRRVGGFSYICRSQAQAADRAAFREAYEQEARNRKREAVKNPGAFLVKKNQKQIKTMGAV